LLILGIRKKEFKRKKRERPIYRRIDSWTEQNPLIIKYLPLNSVTSYKMDILSLRLLLSVSIRYFLINISRNSAGIFKNGIQRNVLCVLLQHVVRYIWHIVIMISYTYVTLYA